MVGYLLILKHLVAIAATISSILTYQPQLFQLQIRVSAATRPISLEKLAYRNYRPTVDLKSYFLAYTY